MLRPLFKPDKIHEHGSVWLRSVLALGCFLLLNVVFQWAAVRFGYRRYFLGAELLLAILVAGFVSRWLGIAVFLGAVALECAVGLTGVFHFTDLRESLDLLEFTFLGRTDFIVLLGGLLTVVTLCFWWSARYVHQTQARRGWLVILLVVAGLVYGQWRLSDGGENFFTPVHADRSTLLFGSAAYLLQDSMNLNRIRQAVNGDPDIDYHPITHPSAAQLTVEGGRRSSRILFIVSEAWGLPKNARMLEEQIQALRASPHAKDLKLSSVYARGATAAGELRELCGLIPSRMNFGKMTRDLVGECLPLRLHQEGYETVAVHGASSSMYRRSRWYPVLGFKKLVFMEDMPASNASCFSFPGYCDRNIFSLLGNDLGKDRVFVYWLTLNSHVPYDRRDVVSYRESLCRSVLGDGYGELLCNYQNLHVQFFEEMAEFLKGATAKGIEVVVVGDHPPIFLDDDSRQRFVADQVPVLHFVVQ